MSIKAVSETGELVPAPKNLPSTLFEDFERRDDDQIMAEIQGGVIAEYMYEFEQGGQTITGLSLPGVMAVAQNMGGITCGQPIWSVDDEYDELVCDISATDHKNGLTVWGTAAAPRMMDTKRGKVRDKFARAKALSKAQRNAIRKLIPEKFATQMLVMFREQRNGNQRQLDRPRQQRQQQRPAAVEAQARVVVPTRTVDTTTGEIVDGEYTEAAPEMTWHQFWTWARSQGIGSKTKVAELIGDGVREMSAAEAHAALDAYLVGLDPDELAAITGLDPQLNPTDEELEGGA